MFIIYGIFVLLFSVTDCHVRLTFPKARYPPLDFLDNARTTGPCGVPKPKTDQDYTKTTLKAGSSINVTWSLAYPHKGGFRLEILNESDLVQHILTPERQEYVGDDDPTKQSFRVTLPNKPCQNCTIRLVRQALDWGDNYIFWSCADVDIELTPTERCSNHGRYYNGQCQCERLYNGDVCQYQDECLNDQDCGGNGKCLELEIFSYPRKLCYCKPGWFGTGCQQASKLKSTQFDASLYQQKSLQDGENKLYWRIIKDSNEIEFVLQYYGKSWVAIGWKPVNIDPQCANLNKLASGIFNKPFEPEIATDVPSGPDETAPSSSVTDSTENIQNGFNIVPNLNISDNNAGIVVVTPSKPNVDGTHGAGTENVRIAAVESDVVGDTCYGDWRWPPDCRDCDYIVSWSYVDEFDEIEFSLETRVPSNWWSGIGFSKTGKMADADVIIVKSSDSKITVQDGHLVGYSQPVVDAHQDVNLPDIVGTHVNGILRTAFSRKRKTDDKENDVQFSDDDCFYFLFPVTGGRLDAKSQISQHLDTPKLSKKKICIKSCSSSTGSTGKNGLVGVIDQNTCQREFKFPPNCQPPNCDYYAAWLYNPRKEAVDFQISSRELGRWTGIGFSADGNMTNSDIIMGWVYENGTFLTDRFAYGKHQPAVDRQQDLNDVHGRTDDDIQTIYFSRPLETYDLSEDLSLLDCLYYLFPVGGGRVLAKNADDLRNSKTPIGFHDLFIPKVSRTPICICTDDGYPLIVLNETYVQRAKRSSGRDLTAGDDPGAPEALPNSTYVDSIGQLSSLTTTEINAASTKIVPIVPPTRDQLPTVQPKPPAILLNTDTRGLSGEFGQNSKQNTLHPMDCTDIVIGSAVGGLSKVEDYYTISRATPMVDEVYGGRQSLTSVVGSEDNDVTTIIFRRKLTTNDPADHNIVDRDMTVIWAKGQTSKTGSDKDKIYAQDVVAYHGSKNRGQFTMNFYTKATPDPQAICKGEQSYPPGCSGDGCQYSLTWIKQAENVDFQLDVKMNKEQWTGVGMSKDGAMLKSDAIIIQVNPSGPIEVTDRYMPAYSRPIVDHVQNIFNVDARYVNGRMTAKFTRTVISDDVKEDLDLTDCFYFLYPFQPGTVINGDIQKHNDTPGRSEQICFKKCTAKLWTPVKKPADADDGQTRLTVKKFLLVMKIVNQDWSDALLDSNSEKYKALSAKITGVVDNILSQKFDGFQKSDVLKFRPGSIISELTITASGVKDKDIYDEVQQMAKSDSLKGLKIDPDTVVVQEVRERPTPEEIRNFIIIAVACFLVVILIIGGICLICYVRRKNSRMNKKSSSNRSLVPFTPYAYMIPNDKQPPPYHHYPPSHIISDKKTYDNRMFHGNNSNMDYANSSNRSITDYYATRNNASSSIHNDNASSMVDGRLSQNNKRPHQQQQQQQQNQQSASLNFRHAPSSLNNSNRSKNRSHGHQQQQQQQQQQRSSGHHQQQEQHRRRRTNNTTTQQHRHHQQHQQHQGGYGSQQQDGPYVQYPNDPHSYYTMNGVNRVQPTPAPRTSYFGHY